MSKEQDQPTPEVVVYSLTQGGYAWDIEVRVRTELAPEPPGYTIWFGGRGDSREAAQAAGDAAVPRVQAAVAALGGGG
ncbi:hypothetical protein HQ590_07140 [bacterium]|nr:hypothetical protein [bacterium]